MQSNFARVDHSVDRPASGGEILVVAVAAAAMSLLLNQSARVGGLNLSVADPVLVVTLVALCATRRLYVFRYSVVFFCVLLAVTVATTIWITPVLQGVQPDDGAVVAGLAKLATSLLYFIC